MGVTPARWLIDKSALWRASRPELEAVVLPQLESGLVAVTIVTELEVGYSAQSLLDYQVTRRMLDQLLQIPVSLRAEQRAREVQRLLVERGQHRSAGVADLLLAATAEIEGLTLWHYDADFDLIAEVTGQAAEWVVPRGTVD
ncbi:MAG TPA: PIN domain nuclease [Acidimicrobiales bacterium]|jgi:predicted nucleic acid-binding protein|nr:PIN domain nuclease [Acidimicrobiales bacterium]